MQKRNFILFIIILVIIIMAVFGYLYLRRTPDTPNNPGGTNFVSEFNPFGQTTPTTPGNNTPGDNTEDNNLGDEFQNLSLMKVSSMPVAGFAVYQKERYKEVPVVVPDLTPAPITAKGGTPPKRAVAPPPTEIVPALRYVARSNGNIFETFADKIEERQFSTTIIPKIYEAFFGNKTESVIMRNLKLDERTISTFGGTLPKEVLGGDTTGNNEVKGVFLPDNISDMSISPDKSKIFYLLNVGDNAVGVTSGFLGDKKVQVFDSPFTEWLSFWPNSKMITLTTKPSYFAPGYMYAVNPDKKDFVKILGNINGLTTLTSPDSKLVLYTDSTLSLNVYNISTGGIVGLPIKTMPEKCIWDKTSVAIYCAVPKFIDSALYPDDWYQGEVSFFDDIWKIDTVNGNGSLLLDPTTVPGGESIDGIKLALDDGENYLFFVNKKDSILWEAKLK